MHNSAQKEDRCETQTFLQIIICKQTEIFQPWAKTPIEECSILVYNGAEIPSPMSQPHFEGSVGSPLILPKMGLGNPSGLPKTQNVIARVKTPCIEV